MKKRNLERMRYKNDALASGLCLAAVGCDVVYFIAIYSRQTVVPDMRMGGDIILNILFLLVGFLASEQAKVYARNWSFVMLGLAAAQLARGLWLPEHYHELGQLVGGAYSLVRMSILASAALMLAAGIVCYINSTALRAYLQKSGA